MTNIFTLALEFLKTGLFAIGGGLATLPFLLEMSNKYPHWFTKAELADMIAISESTPGAIGINMSTYVGFKTAGIFGGIIASLSLILPAIIIIVLISKFMDKYQKNPTIQSMFNGLRPAVSGLIASAGYTVFKLFAIDANTGQINYLHIAVFLVFLAATQIKKLSTVHPIIYIVVAAILGIALKL